MSHAAWNHAHPLYRRRRLIIIVTAIVGYATIPWLLGFLRKRTTFVFIVYRLLLAGLLLLLLASGRIS